MSIQNKITCTVSSSGGGISLNGTVSESGATEINVDENYAASASNILTTCAFTAANVQSLFLYSDKGCTIKTNGSGTNEVQTITITGTPTSGTFALGYGGQITAPIAFDAIAADVQTALRALSTIGSGNVNVAGGPLPGSAVTATFVGTLASKNVETLTSNIAGLGGGSPAITITATTPGLPSNTIVLAPGIPLVWDVSAGYFSNPFTVDVTAWYVSSTFASRLQAKILTG